MTKKKENEELLYAYNKKPENIVMEITYDNEPQIITMDTDKQPASLTDHIRKPTKITLYGMEYKPQEFILLTYMSKNHENGYKTKKTKNKFSVKSLDGFETWTWFGKEKKVYHNKDSVSDYKDLMDYEELKTLIDENPMLRGFEF